jgi:hypothetical protein
MEGFRVQGSGFRKAALRFVELTLESLFEAIEHSHALLVPVTNGLERLLRDVLLPQGNVNVMDCFERLAASPIDSFDLIPDVPIAVFLRQVRGGTVRGTPHLRSQLVPLLRGPGVRQITHVQMKIAQPLINEQVFDAEKACHTKSPRIEERDRNFSTPSNFLFLNPEP